MSPQERDMQRARGRLGELDAKLPPDPYSSIEYRIGFMLEVARLAGPGADDVDPMYERLQLQLACWLMELRARRKAMGRDPDDERNAVADLACPSCGDIMVIHGGA